MRIYITGMGVISGLGFGKESTLEGLLNMRTAVGKMKYLKSIHTDIPVAEVPFSNEELRKMSGSDQSHMVRTSLLGRVALLEAMKEANLNKERMALIFGTTVGGMDLFEQYWDKMLADNTYDNLISSIECSLCTEQIISGIDGFDFITTTSTACSSALNSIIAGAEMIQSGRVEIALCGGGECLSRYHLNGFNSLKILDSEPCRPFDNSRAGLNLGEGAAFLVLESESSVRRRGVKVIAEVCGYANACDAYHQTASSPDGEGAYLAMKKAIESAGLRLSDIDYINAHGTGTPNNDPSEATAMCRLFGESIPPVSSTKGFTGHTTSASGAIESVISILAMNEGFIPSNINFKEKMDDVPFIPSTGIRKKQIKYVLVNSFGFGGNDSSCIFGKTEG